MDLKEEDILGEEVSGHWYYKAKAEALRVYVEPLNAKCVLDIGAGSGFFSEWLLRNTPLQQSICVDISYPVEHEKHLVGKSIRYLRACDRVEADLVLLMDVLEHVDNDAGLLREYVEKVSAGTHFFITVPAFSFLWSAHDEFLEHKRRYTLQQIEAVVAQAGLCLVHGSYYFGLVFPLALATRLAGKLFAANRRAPSSQLKAHSPMVNGLLSGICALDRHLLLKVNRLAGLSAFCLARKLDEV